MLSNLTLVVFMKGNEILLNSLLHIAILNLRELSIKHSFSNLNQNFYYYYSKTLT